MTVAAGCCHSDGTALALDAARAFVVHSPSMTRIVEQARRAAASKVSVLIEGESGTGKELLARFIHLASPRAGKPLVSVNCAALSESLVESELFGHEKGAFTGAESSHAGRFERADGGTLLLDEISEMSVKLQAKLLRVLEEEEFERVGGVRSLRVDVRVIATTNRCLEQEKDTFRRDLYYRLNAMHFHVPPLRARREDIVPLARHFFGRFRHEAAASLAGLSDRALEMLASYSWPGNIRQLRNVIQRACILASGPLIEADDLQLLDAGPHLLPFPGQTIESMEKQMILRTLEEVGGNKTAAALRLGVTPRTLLNKLKKYLSEEAA